MYSEQDLATIRNSISIESVVDSYDLRIVFELNFKSHCVIHGVGNDCLTFNLDRNTFQNFCPKCKEEGIPTSGDIFHFVAAMEKIPQKAPDLKQKAANWLIEKYGSEHAFMFPVS